MKMADSNVYTGTIGNTSSGDPPPSEGQALLALVWFLVKPNLSPSRLSNF